MPTLYNALIRTHHVTSRKKVAALTQAAKKHDVYALLRSGGSPGIMYVEGDESGVSTWVGDVKRLRYLDYKLLRKPAELRGDGSPPDRNAPITTGLHELESVKDFGAEMKRRGVLQWWRKAMEFDPPDDRL